MSERIDNEPLTDDNIMPFGKWMGYSLGNVPDHYWLWFLKQPWSNTYPKLVVYAKCCEENEDE